MSNANAETEALARGPTDAAAAVICGGLIAGTIDIGSACVINMLSPRIILQAIASGLLGAASFQGGLPAELAGLGLQWGMSLLIAAIFVVGAMRIRWLRRHWIAAGAAYGVVIYAVMNYVVVPLSAAPFHPSTHLDKIVENLLAMLLFGLIVAGTTRVMVRDRGS